MFTPLEILEGNDFSGSITAYHFTILDPFAGSGGIFRVWQIYPTLTLI